MLFYAAVMLGKLTSTLAALAPSGSYDNLQISPTDAICNVTLNSAGTVTLSTGTTGSAANWLTGTGTGANYWVKFTATSGTLTTGTAGTWQQLSGNITFGTSFTTNTAGSKICTGTIQIATDSAGVNIISTGSVTLNAQVDL